MAAPFWFGSAKVDVTPPAGLQLAGYGGRTQPAEGVLSPLYAHASVCRSGDTWLALCSVDVIGISREETNRIRRNIERETGIPPSRALIATTHTHAGPVTTDFRNAVPDPRYMDALGHGIVKAIVSAKDSLLPVSLSVGRTAAPQWHHNRRDEAGPTDPTLLMARFVSDTGAPLAAWTNYGCHPTILGGDNLRWSAEYPGVLCDMIERELGGTATFFNGCHGDVGPHRPERTFAEVERVGKGLAALAVGLAEGMEYAPPDRIAGDSLLCRVPLDTLPTLEELEALASTEKGRDYEREWAKRFVALHKAGKSLSDFAEVEIQHFRIGELTLLCFPGQLFASWGLELRRRWRGGPLMIVNQANDHAGYFPDRAGWELGGYEVRSAFKFNSDLPAPMTWEAGKMLVDKAILLAEGATPP